MSESVKELRDKFNLSYKQVLFCIKYSGNATEAAKYAGYKWPDKVGSQLLGKDRINECIAYVNTPKDKHTIKTAQDLIDEFAKLIADDKAGISDKLRALENIGKIRGLYAPEKKAFMGHLTHEHLSNLSDEQLLSKLKQELKVAIELGSIPVAMIEQIGESAGLSLDGSPFESEPEEPSD